MSESVVSAEVQAKNVMSDEPTFENFVEYEFQDPPRDGCIRCYRLMGLKDPAKRGNIFLWRNYNTFDDVSTPVPAGYVLRNNGYEDCDDCCALGECCPEDIPKLKEHMQRFRFGTRVFAKHYKPQKVDCAGTPYMIHDNGGRPYRVYVDYTANKIHVYALNRNLIFEDPNERRDYKHTNLVMFAAGTEFQLAMNPREESSESRSGESKSGDNKDSPLQNDNNAESDSSDEPTDQNETNENDTIDMIPYYDQFVVSCDYEKVWVPLGLYLTRGDDGIETQNSENFRGNTILAQLSEGKYLYIGTSVRVFKTDDHIVQYYSLVGNSDVPYPVAVGEKYVFFMEGGPAAEPIEKYKNVENMEDAYSYYYGHICCVCNNSDCDCKMPEYPYVDVESEVLCARYW